MTNRLMRHIQKVAPLFIVLLCLTALAIPPQDNRPRNNRQANDTASVENVLTVPVEAVNVDDKEEFVFTFTPSTMMVGKKYVKTGVSSDLLIEITEGLDTNDLIVTDYTGVVEDGKMATPAPESQELIAGELGKK